MKTAYDTDHLCFARRMDMPNYGRRWTPEEDAIILRMVAWDRSWTEINKKLGRNNSQNRYYILKAGINYMKAQEAITK